MLKATAAKTAPASQNTVTTLVSDQPDNSKWWCMGLILKTRLPVDLKEITWIMTERASMTKTPPTITSKNSVFVITATAANAPPKASDPVSPIKTLAGCALYRKKPRQAPASAAQKIARCGLPKYMAITAYASAATVVVPAAKPSRPSVRLTAFVVPTSTIKISKEI